jgi:hypothetical protein
MIERDVSIRKLLAHESAAYRSARLESLQHYPAFFGTTYQDPEARPPLTIDSTVGDFIDDAEAWAAVMNTIARLAPRAPFIRRMIQGQSGTRLREVLVAVPNAGEVRAAIESALAALGR